VRPCRNTDVWRKWSQPPRDLRVRTRDFRKVVGYNASCAPAERRPDGDRSAQVQIIDASNKRRAKYEELSFVTNKPHRLRIPKKVLGRESSRRGGGLGAADCLAALRRFREQIVRRFASTSTSRRRRRSSLKSPTSAAAGDVQLQGRFAIERRDGPHRRPRRGRSGFTGGKSGGSRPRPVGGRPAAVSRARAERRHPRAVPPPHGLGARSRSRFVATTSVAAGEAADHRAALRGRS